MGQLAKRVFFHVTLALALMCFACLFFVKHGTAEYFFTLFAGIINCSAVLVQLIVMLVKGRKQ